MRRESALVGIAVLMSVWCANAQTPATKNGAPTKDRAFITEAAIGGMAEVDLGQLASSQASNDKVKAFGQKMVADHGKAGDELKRLAASKQVTVPTTLDAKHKAAHDRFAKMSGADFDRAYVADMVADHKKDVADFMKESTSGKDPEVQAWATKTLPTLQEHLRMIEEIQRGLGGRSTSTK